MVDWGAHLLGSFAWNTLTQHSSQEHRLRPHQSLLLPHFRFNLHLHWTTTIFILNLAFADSLYCAINLPLYAMQYLKQRWTWGPDLCYITTAFRYINAFADWMSVAMIAVSRCVSLTRPELGEKIFGGRNGKLIILAIWVYANLLILPIYTKVSPMVNIVSKG